MHKQLNQHYKATTSHTHLTNTKLCQYQYFGTDGETLIIKRVGEVGKS